MTPLSAAEDVGALWLALLQRAMGRASHDVKDAINGVSVNLEVIRSRAAKPELPASAIAQFGEAASQQLERLTALLDAVLGLSRPERDPADVALTLRRVAALCGASASASDATVRVHSAAVESTTTAVRGDVVRIALMAPLLDAVASGDGSLRGGEVRCVLGDAEDAVLLEIAGGDRVVAMPGGVADLVRAAGVRWTETDGNLSLAFPRT